MVGLAQRHLSCCLLLLLLHPGSWVFFSECSYVAVEPSTAVLSLPTPDPLVSCASLQPYELKTFLGHVKPF